MLSRLGYRVEAFESAREALERFSSDPDAFDLVITDQTMPGLTGSELAPHHPSNGHAGLPGNSCANAG